MRHPEPSNDALLLFHASDARRRICSAALQGSRSYNQSWIALQSSGADPSASRQSYRSTLHFAWLASGWRVVGARWIADRDVWIQQLRKLSISPQSHLKMPTPFCLPSPPAHSWQWHRAESGSSVLPAVPQYSPGPMGPAPRASGIRGSRQVAAK
jgi:hypothetical protein